MISKKTLLFDFLPLRQSKFDLENLYLYFLNFSKFFHKYEFKSGAKITVRKAGFNVQYADRYRKF